MSAGLATVIIIASLLILLSSGIPIAFGLIGLSALFMYIFVGPDSLYFIYTNTFRVVTKDIYVAVPLFILMATVLQYSGMIERLYDVMYKWFGGLRGGLAIGTIVISTLIAAMTATGATATVTMGLAAYPEMKRRGYHNRISLGCIPPGGALGPLIPPSILMIMIGGFAQLSVGKLFFGGVFPGLLMAFLFIVYIAAVCFRHPQLAPSIPAGERASWREKWRSLIAVILPIVLIFLVLGTLYLGIATPSEAGGVGAFGTLVCAAIYRKLNWSMLKAAVFQALKVTCLVYWLLAGGSAFSSLMTLAGASKVISDSLIGTVQSPMVILVIMMLIGLVMGMIMDTSAIIMICIPIFMPVVIGLGVDPLWFALLFTINMVIGYVTPPYGINLFYLKGCLPDVPMGDIYRSVLPYVYIMLVVLIVGFLFPPLLTWLPNKVI